MNVKLDNIKVYDFLGEQGIECLYHANTVATACTFISEGGLLSRGEVERRDLFQTPQSSDDADRQFDVWNDIFLDSVDLHGRFPRQNFYGPVLFKFSIDILKHPHLPELHVTKDNPIYWSNDMRQVEKYFQSNEEFENIYRDGAYKEMLTFKNTSDILPFEDYLLEIILDNPRVLVEEVSLRKTALKELKQAIDTSEIDYSHVVKTLRKDCGHCFCTDNYLNKVSTTRLKELFFRTD